MLFLLFLCRGWSELLLLFEGGDDVFVVCCLLFLGVVCVC